MSQLLRANKANPNLLTYSYVIDEENFFMSAGSRLALVLIPYTPIHVSLLLKQRPAKVPLVVLLIRFIVLSWFETDKAPGTLS